MNTLHHLRVWGDLACFTRPEMKVERVSYPVPTPYDISGSAHWRNKADNCLTIWRDENEPDAPVKVFVQKIRFREVGKVGLIELHWNVVNGRYEDTVVRDTPTHWQEGG